MCGITGFISPYLSKSSFQQNIECMTNTLEHRGPMMKGYGLILIWIALGHSGLDHRFICCRSAANDL